MSTDGTFCWYELRTTDVGAAEAFYGEVAGWRVQSSPESRTFYLGEARVGGLMDLPERARSQGAPAHWLGHLRVPEVDASVRGLVGCGGQVLGPVRRAADGDVAIVRDAQGAVLALSSRPEVTGPGGIAWHELHTTDGALAWSSYSELFGWRPTDPLELGPEVGPYRMFTWSGAARSVGGIVSTARAPHIHTHWLFYLTVVDLDGALARVRALGGRVANGPMQVPGGDRVAQCEDPQGAAFALAERAPSP